MQEAVQRTEVRWKGLSILNIHILSLVSNMRSFHASRVSSPTKSSIFDAVIPTLLVLLLVDATTNRKVDGAVVGGDHRRQNVASVSDRHRIRRPCSGSDVANGDEDAGDESATEDRLWQQLTIHQSLESVVQKLRLLHLNVKRVSDQYVSIVMQTLTYIYAYY